MAVKVISEMGYAFGETNSPLKIPVHKRSVDIGDDDSYTYIDDMSDYNNMLKKPWAQVKLPNFPRRDSSADMGSHGNIHANSQITF